MKRTGVIIGVDHSITPDQAEYVAAQLRERFPGVEFAVVSNSHGNITFEFDNGEPTDYIFRDVYPVQS